MQGCDLEIWDVPEVKSTMTLAFCLLLHREVALKMRRRRLGFWAAEAADGYRTGY